MTELITSIMGLAGIAVGGTITWASTRRNNLTTSYQHLVEAQGELKNRSTPKTKKSTDSYKPGMNSNTSATSKPATSAH